MRIVVQIEIDTEGSEARDGSCTLATIDGITDGAFPDPHDKPRGVFTTAAANVAYQEGLKVGRALAALYGTFPGRSPKYQGVPKGPGSR